MMGPLTRGGLNSLLRGADLNRTDLTHADLSEADLGGADLDKWGQSPFCVERSLMLLQKR